MSHDHTTHHDWADEADKLTRDAEMELPWITDAIRWLDELRPGITSVIDLGAGPGVATIALAEILDGAHVTAIDSTPSFAALTRRRAEEAGVGPRVDGVTGALGSLEVDVDPAALVWASRVMHHMPDPVEGLRHLAALVAPEGIMAVVEGGLPLRVLPGGYGVGSPGFPARIDAALLENARHRWGLTDEAVGGDADWPELFAAAGLTHVASRSFVLEHRAPVADSVRRYLHDRFVSVTERLGETVEAEDLRALARLVDADDPASIARRRDLFVLSASTVHVARH